MLKRIGKVFVYFFLSLSPYLLNGQTIDQRLNVVTNEQTLGGSYQVQVEVKGTNLPMANTLGSATIDVEFDNTALSYVNSSGWAFSSAEGYSRSATDNTTFIRVFVTGGGVNENCADPPDPAGFDIGTTYTSWVTLNFTIADPSGSAGLNIKPIPPLPGTNEIGLFDTHQNSDCLGVITNQNLSYNGVTGNDHPLPVELASFIAVGGDGRISLKWVTASESDNLGFELYRSEEEEGEFQQIASYENDDRLKSSGNSNAEQTYAFIDQNLINQKTYWYKLADVEFNGERFFHNSVSAVTNSSDLPISKLENIPVRFELYKNYPNPFNPETNIKFELPASSMGGRNIKLAVYNSLGMAVRTLYAGPMEPGVYVMQWDGRNDWGDQIASGVYFVRLQTYFLVKTMKILLIR